MKLFTDLNLPAALLESVAQAGYAELTPVQSQALPLILERKDVLALAPTGSGKTAAFALGILNTVEISRIQTQALVLCPTRELADQVGGQIRKLGNRMANLKVSVLTGGTPMGPQLNSLKVHDPHVVVGTPGRILDLLRKKALHLRGVHTLVLDEADRMLDMGFAEPLSDILAKVPGERQTLLFSATMPEAAESLAQAHMRSPVRIQAAAQGERHLDIETAFLSVPADRKQQALAQLLDQRDPNAAVVFCNTRKACDEVSATLDRAGFSVLALHGDFEQRDRDEVMIRFANESANVLVATDVAARGLDVSHIDLVVNYDVPFEPEVYVHRIGRTGRAGAKGHAVTFVTESDGQRMAQIDALLGVPARIVSSKPAALAQGVKHLAPMRTLRLDAGKTDKLRPGDILGTLTAQGGVQGDAIGKINVTPLRSYVAVRRGQANQALNHLRNSKIKGKRVRVYLFD